MTAAVPLVERLAEALAKGARLPHTAACPSGPFSACECPTKKRAYDTARALLPVVEQAVAEARGEALRAAGQDYLAQHAGSGHRRPVDVRRWLFNRADAIATTEGAK